ncbi:hypothetical protein BDZ97DRAFT_1834585 [Flammula alnicola]|nr:hypothetical protein BDZ97DRAFT_1834585 [Flammula alnicola]
MTLSYATDEPSTLLWYEQAVNASAHIGAMAYGLHIAVIYKCFDTIFRDKERRGFKWIPFIGSLFVLGTINIASSIHFNELAWIDARNYPNGAIAFLLEQQDNPANVTAVATSIVTLILADTFLIYRVHALWRKFYITGFLGLVLLASIVLSVFHGIQVAQITTILQDPSSLRFSVPYASLATSLNILISIALLSRLLDLRRRVSSTTSTEVRHRYTGIEALVVESALPSGLFSFLFLILYGLHNTGSILFFPLLVQIMGIIPELILLRMLQGHAWSSKTIRTVGVNTAIFRGQLGRSVGAPVADDVSMITLGNDFNNSPDTKVHPELV